MKVRFIITSDFCELLCDSCVCDFFLIRGSQCGSIGPSDDSSFWGSSARAVLLLRQSLIERKIIIERTAFGEIFKN